MGRLCRREFDCGAEAGRTIPGFYQTSAGAEIDLVLERPNRGPLAIEIKSGAVPTIGKDFSYSRSPTKNRPRASWSMPGRTVTRSVPGLKRSACAKLMALLDADEVQRQLGPAIAETPKRYRGPRNFVIFCTLRSISVIAAIERCFIAGLRSLALTFKLWATTTAFRLRVRPMAAAANDWLSPCRRKHPPPLFEYGEDGLRDQNRLWFKGSRSSAR